MKMSWQISLIAFSVGLLACTDYKAEVQSALEDYSFSAQQNAAKFENHTGCECFIGTNGVFEENGSYFVRNAWIESIEYVIRYCFEDAKITELDPGYDESVVSKAEVTYTGSYYDSDGRGGSSFGVVFELIDPEYDGFFQPAIGVLDKYHNSLERLLCPGINFEQDVPVPENKNSSSAQGSYSSSSRMSSSSVKRSSSSSNRDERRVNLWNGAAGEYRATTGKDAGLNESGYWFAFTDSKGGGGSVIDWPVNRGNQWSDDAFDPVIDYCGGFCGSVTLVQGSQAYNPFVGMGFCTGGPVESGKECVETDISDWGGICVAYSSTINIELEIGLLAEKQELVKSSLPKIYLKATQGKEKYGCYYWSDFVTEDWGQSIFIDGEEASHIAKELKFEIRGEDGATGDFNIISLGTIYDP